MPIHCSKRIAQEALMAKLNARGYSDANTGVIYLNGADRDAVLESGCWYDAGSHRYHAALTATESGKRTLLVFADTGRIISESVLTAESPVSRSGKAKPCYRGTLQGKEVCLWQIALGFQIRLDERPARQLPSAVAERLYGTPQGEVIEPEEFEPNPEVVDAPF
jgi:hypothetical protein